MPEYLIIKRLIEEIVLQEMSWAATVRNPSPLDIFLNPSMGEMRKEGFMEDNTVRAILVGKNRAYVWNPYGALHLDVLKIGQENKDLKIGRNPLPISLEFKGNKLEAIHISWAALSSKISKSNRWKKMHGSNKGDALVEKYLKSHSFLRDYWDNGRNGIGGTRITGY